MRSVVITGASRLVLMVYFVASSSAFRRPAIEMGGCDQSKVRLRGLRLSPPQWTSLKSQPAISMAGRRGFTDSVSQSPARLPEQAELHGLRRLLLALFASFCGS